MCKNCATHVARINALISVRDRLSTDLLRTGADPEWVARRAGTDTWGPHPIDTLQDALAQTFLDVEHAQHGHAHVDLAGQPEGTRNHYRERVKPYMDAFSKWLAAGAVDADFSWDPAERLWVYGRAGLPCREGTPWQTRIKRNWARSSPDAGDEADNAQGKGKRPSELTR